MRGIDRDGVSRAMIEAQAAHDRRTYQQDEISALAVKLDLPFTAVCDLTALLDELRGGGTGLQRERVLRLDRALRPEPEPDDEATTAAEWATIKAVLDLNPEGA